MARIKRYFSPSVLANEKRSISKSLLEYGIENFSLQIYKIDPVLFEGEFSLRERALSLALEQYLTSARWLPFLSRAFSYSKE